MKNICWMTLVLLCFQQGYAQRKMYIGLLGSPCISWLQPRTTDVDSKGTRIGFSYGVMTDFNFNENYAFGTGIKISHHGGEISYTSVDTKTSELYKLQYLEVPITLKMRTKEIGYFTYYGQFGLGTSFLIGAKGDAKFINGSTTTKESDVNIYDDLQPFRASMIIGLGTEYNISGSTRIVIGASFNNSFVNPLKGHIYNLNENGEIVKGDKIKVVSNYVSLDLGIIF